MTNLTKDSKRLIALIYSEYLCRRDRGISKGRAKEMGSSIELLQRLNIDISQEDMDETCRELDRAGMLEIRYADDIPYGIRLSDSGIVLLENHFKNGIKDVLLFISNFIP